MGSRLYLLTPLFAVATLPVGILTALFAGPMAAAVVFVVGWFLLVPVTAILFGGEMMAGMPDDIEQLAEEEMQAAITGSDSGDETGEDPVEVLRQRYARGEISDEELERGLEALLETEGVDSDDSEDIEKTIDRLHDIEQRDELLTEKN